MKVFVSFIAFVAYASTAGHVSGYGSGVGVAGSLIINLGSVGLGSGIGTNSGLGVQRLAVTQPTIYSSFGSIGLTGFSGNSYESGFGLNQSQTFQQVSIPHQSILSTENDDLSGIGQNNKGQVLSRVSVSQQSLNPLSLQRPSIRSGIGLTQGVSRIAVAQPVITENSNGTNSAPVRSVSVVQQKLIPSNNGVSSVQKERPVSVTQPIATDQPIQTVKVSAVPTIAAQPIRTVQTARQPIAAKSPIGLSGASFGSSGLGIGQRQSLSQGVSRITVAQPVARGRSPGTSNAPARSVSVVQQKLIPSNNGVSSVQKARPVSYTQPIATAQPIQAVKVSAVPTIAAQPIRTVQTARQPIAAKSPIGLSGASFESSGLGIGQRQSLSEGVSRVTVAQPVATGRSLGISNAPARSVSVVQQKLIPSNNGVSSVQKARPVSYTQPIATAQPIQTVKVSAVPTITAQPIRTVQVARQSIAAKSPIGLSGASFESPGLGIGRRQSLIQGVSRVTVAQPVATGRSLGISNAPARSVSVVQQKLIPSNNGVSSVQKARPVSYTQPIATAQPIQTVKVSAVPTITAQPIRTVQVARQPIAAISPIGLIGASFGSSGLEISQGQAVRRVTLAQPILIPLNSGISSGISNQLNLSPVSFSQPKASVQPIRTIQIASQPIVSSSQINVGGTTHGSGLGLGLNQVQPIRLVSSPVQPSLSAKSYGLTALNYGISSTNSLPILTSSNYGLTSGINNIGGRYWQSNSW